LPRGWTAPAPTPLVARAVEPVREPAREPLPAAPARAPAPEPPEAGASAPSIRF
jgi:hypothetical protein